MVENGDQQEATVLSSVLNKTRYFSNSRWYAELTGRFLNQADGGMAQDGTRGVAPGQTTGDVMQATVACLERLS